MLNRPPLEFYVPEPETRPGQSASFAHLTIPMAGLVRRPDALESSVGMRDLPFELIRVLDDEGGAIGPWNPGLSGNLMRQGLKAMILTRIFDDRLFRAHRQGKTSFYMKSTGEEAIGAAQSLILERQDMCFPTYRVMSWLHARGYPLVDMVNQIFSNERDPLRGRQLPMLFSARDYGFYSLSGNLGTRFGHAVGWAMASAYRQTDSIALAYSGEGTTAEGAFHEALTFAAVYRVPAILCVTNNQWAISSFSGIAGTEETTFAARAIGYGLPGLRVDGNDFLAVAAATQWAVERARANRGATLIEFFTYRASGHSTSDDPTRYRPRDEAEHWPLGDPIERLKQHLVRQGEWDEERHAALMQTLEVEVRAAIREGEAVGTLGRSKPPLSEMFEGVFAEPDWRLIEQRREAGM